MDRIFRDSKENTAARSDDRARVSTLLPAKKTSKPERFKLLPDNDTRHPPELGLLRSGRVRARLTVHAPRRLTRFDGPQNPDAQAIPAKDEPLQLR